MPTDWHHAEVAIDHEAKPSFAAATACSTLAAPACSTAQRTWPVAGLMLSNRSPDAPGA
jgi:hypothetical protein